MPTNRAPLQIVEIDMDFCDNVFGTAPCTASAASGLECFNTFKTCQDPDNYAKGALTLRFSKNQKTGIFGQIVFPALQGISTSPTIISLGNTDDMLGSLGKRARLTVKLRDFKWSDTIVDKYAGTRAYDPMERGTFFAKWRARSPYYYGRSLRVKSGYVGDDIAAMHTANWVITDFEGPDANGEVTFTAQDPLKLADEEFAVCPRPSSGYLAADIAADYTGTVGLLPAGIGSEYDVTGRISVGSEIMAYTRSGDTLTIVGRGIDGSEAAAHDEGDTAQLCYRCDNATIDGVVYELLNDYSGIEAGLLPTAAWQAEIKRWLPTVRLTRTIATPTPVRELLGQIANFGVAFWWDEVENKVALRVNRPPDHDETFAEISDAADVLESSASRSDMNGKRISRAAMWHGVLDFSRDNSDESENYDKLALHVNADAESGNEYGQTRQLTLYQPWLGSEGNTQFADIVVARLVNRFRDTPVHFEFIADIKDRDALRPGALVEIRSNLIVDEFGEATPYQMQVLSVDEFDPGHRVRVVAETYQFRGRYGFITENTRPTYSASTEEQKRVGAYFSDGSNNFPDGTPPYKFF